MVVQVFILKKVISLINEESTFDGIIQYDENSNLGMLKELKYVVSVEADTVIDEK